jgi:hypothetical protein
MVMLERDGMGDDQKSGEIETMWISLSMVDRLARHVEGRRVMIQGLDTSDVYSSDDEASKQPRTPTFSRSAKPVPARPPESPEQPPEPLQPQPPAAPPEPRGLPNEPDPVKRVLALWDTLHPK